MSASEPAIVAPSYHLTGEPFGGLLIPQDLTEFLGRFRPGSDSAQWRLRTSSGSELLVSNEPIFSVTFRTALARARSNGHSHQLTGWQRPVLDFLCQ